MFGRGGDPYTLHARAPLCALPVAEPPTADSPVVDTFCLVCLAVEEVDHLQLASNVRHRYLRSGGGSSGSSSGAEGAASGGGDGGEWTTQNVNP